MKLFFKSIFIILPLLTSSCLSTKDAALIYFHNQNHHKGVEPYRKVITRAKKDKDIKKIMYQKLSTNTFIQCTLLRHQLYSALLTGMSGSNKKNIVEAARLIEEAYQQDDQIFLSACRQILKSETGKNFVSVQRSYIGNDNP